MAAVASLRESFLGVAVVVATMVDKHDHIANHQP